MSVVVGVDGSHSSQRALSWALDEGRRRGSTVHVIHAWWLPPDYVAYQMIPGASGQLEAQLQDEGHALIQRMLDELADEAADVPVETEIVNAPPARALIERSNDAECVVVGSRGRGGFASLLLGSVSQQLVQHATCPVTVIPPGA